MTLYEINEVLKNALQNIDPETGEVLADLDELEIQRNDLIEGIALSIKNDTALIEAIKAEIENLQKRVRAISNSVEWKKRYVGNALIRIDSETGEAVYDTFKSAKCDLRWRKSEKVEIEDESVFIAMYPNYCATKIEMKPDRKLIKAEIESGREIAGAMVVQNRNLQVR